MENIKELRKSKYRIIALVNKWDVFVDSTCAQSDAHLCSTHVTGKNFLTSKSFNKNDADVELYELDVIPHECTYKEAEYYLIAWIRYYMDEGYNVLCNEASKEMASVLDKKSQKIFDCILTENKKPVFKKKVSKRNKAKKAKKYTKDSYVQMNIRVKSNVKSEFKNHCEEYGLSHNDAMSILMNLVSGDTEYTNRYLLDAIKIKQQRINELNEKLLCAENKYSELCDQVSNSIIPRYSKVLKSASDYTWEFCNLFLKENNIEVKIKPHSWIEYNDIHKYYHYPRKSAYNDTVFKFETMAYGEKDKKLLFVFGEDYNGRNIKFRLYFDSLDKYMGIPIFKYDNSHMESLWYVSFKFTKDGACNMTGSFPIPLLMNVDENYVPSFDEDAMRAEKIKRFVAEQQKYVWDEISFKKKSGKLPDLDKHVVDISQAVGNKRSHKYSDDESLSLDERINNAAQQVK